MNDETSDISRCSPEPSPSPPLWKTRSQSPSPRLLMGRGWQGATGGSTSPLCRSNPMIRQSLSPSESSSSVGPCLLRLTKDPVQPSTGSLSDIRRPQGGHEGATDEDDETLDEFPDESRPRAFTCPVTRAFNRKLRARILNRPPTPTYKDLTTSQRSTNFDFQLLDLNEKTVTTTMTTTSSSGGGVGGVGGGERRMSNGPPELEAIMETF